MGKNYCNLRIRSYYSLMSSIIDPSKIPDKLAHLGMQSGCLCDISSLSCAIQFLKAMKDEKKKPIIGCEFELTDNQGSIYLIAKNDGGWHDLKKLISWANNPKHFVDKPKIPFELLLEYGQKHNLICITGGLNTNVGKAISLDACISESVNLLINRLSTTFGDNLYLEVQLFNGDNGNLAQCIRQLSTTYNIPVVGTPNTLYFNKEDAIDQRVILCIDKNCTLNQALSDPNPYFHSAQFYFPNYQDMLGFGHTEEELENTLKLADRIENYTTILSKPVLPKFDCPNEMTESQYLHHLCELGWAELIENKIPKEKHQEYRDRLEYELGVLERANLPPYFIILADILQFVRDNKWLPGCARGSSASSLVSYLTKIIAVDPVKYDLLFSRFYNEARANSMPDIDIDVPKYCREAVIKYIRGKYGEANVGQIATYHSIQGRGALKGVLKAYGGISFDEMNEMTAQVIEKDKITDELQQMEEDGKVPSIILWSLENTPNKLKKWAYLENDEIKGPLGQKYAQAIRLEGILTTLSKHASGVVITPKPLDEMFPMVIDTDRKNSMVAFTMGDIEYAGGVKIDILGLLYLDRMLGVRQDLREGKIVPIGQ